LKWLDLCSHIPVLVPHELQLVAKLTRLLHGILQNVAWVFQITLLLEPLLAKGRTGTTLAVFLAWCCGSRWLLSDTM
jgi:hypothetical protein